MSSTVKRILWLAPLAALSVALVGCALIYFLLIPSPRTAIANFISFGTKPGDGATEDTLMDPLIVARGDVVPEVLAAVAHRKMPRRRYAIAFLGNSGRKDALPTLLRIMNDTSEEPVFRADALEAISVIDFAQGRRLANEFLGRLDYLGAVAKFVQRGELLPQRTYGEALSTYLCVVLTGC
jgi:hypothetical protein